MLPASLKDDTARMNDRNKHKVTGQMNHQTADPKANASVFLFFPTALFKNNFSQPHKRHICFCPNRTTRHARQNQKSRFFPTLQFD
jgi:hypothetical protein